MKKSIFGMLLVMESLFMLGAMVTALYYWHTAGEGDWQAFAVTSAVTLLSGLLLMRWGEKTKHRKVLSRGDSFIIVALTWALFSLFGALPFIIYDGLPVSLAEAYFETMSGFTTTGATIIDDLDSLPHGLLLWRSMMQWMGGLGIVVFSFALIPVGEMKNANMFQAEVTGISIDRLKPKIGATSRRLLSIYLLFTVVCAGLFWVGPMNFFDAVNHAMTTVATGGYSTHSQSLGYFQSAYVEYVAAVFMIVASINFSLYYYISIRRPKVFWRNEEMHVFLWMVVAAVVVFCLLFCFASGHYGSPDALLPSGVHDIFRSSIFHVATAISSSGFQGQYFDYVGWGAAYWMPTVLLLAMGACAGSTAGGIKVVRMLVYAKLVLKEFMLHLHPRAVVAVRVNGQVMPEDRIRRAVSYLIMYAMLVLLGVVLFTLMGVEVDGSIGCSISMLSNFGPATGNFGPANTFSAMPDAGKWLCSFYMLVGRLEIFTVLFLFMPRAWKQ